MAKTENHRMDLYQRVTDTIIAGIEAGVPPWRKPWSAEHAAGRIEQPLRANQIPYKGINVLLLWGASMASGYASPIWMTYKQSQKFGGQVRKGEKGSMVVYADKIVKKDEGSDDDKVIPFLKSYTVFNSEQVDGLPAHFNAVAQPRLDPVQRIEKAEAFFRNTGATVRIGGNSAYYSSATDHIQMPPFEAFKDAESFYATEAHETIHWTKHETRLDRDFGRKRFGDEGHSREELVAELGSAFTCAALDLTPTVREDHAQYVGHWLNVLKEDKRAIFQAASHAQKAVDYLRDLQPKEAAHATPAAPQPV